MNSIWNIESDTIKKLSNVHVKFLHPHLTSELQPLDQGIIQAMKVCATQLAGCRWED